MSTSKPPKVRCLFCDQRMQCNENKYHATVFKCLNDKCKFKPRRDISHDMISIDTMRFTVGNYGVFLNGEIIDIYNTPDDKQWYHYNRILQIKNNFSVKEIRNFSKTYIDNLLILQ